MHNILMQESWYFQCWVLDIWRRILTGILLRAGSDWPICTLVILKRLGFSVLWRPIICIWDLVRSWLSSKCWRLWLHQSSLKDSVISCVNRNTTSRTKNRRWKTPRMRDNLEQKLKIKKLFKENSSNETNEKVWRLRPNIQILVKISPWF